MRDIKTLLELLLDQYKNNRIDGIQRFGLCWAIWRLSKHELINSNEDYVLGAYIKKNAHTGLTRCLIGGHLEKQNQELNL